jgi:hypothetical protein
MSFFYNSNIFLAKYSKDNFHVSRCYLIFKISRIFKYKDIIFFAFS